jgi:hypothetical protein
MEGTSMAVNTVSNVEENRFWLQIIGDYARLLIHAIPPEDANELRQMRAFISRFDSLLDRARQDLTPEQLKQLNNDAYAATQDIRGFFLQLLNMQVRGAYPLLVKPAIISNAISFTEEYIYLLSYFLKDQPPPMRPLFQLDIFWLFVLSEIAKIISESLGFYQAGLRRRADAFADEFINLLLSCMQLEGISRIGTTDFPIAREQSENVMRELNDFDNYLSELLTLSEQNRLPGTVSVLYLDRSKRMVCYFKRQLAVLNNMEPPSCNPASPRLSNV